MVIYPVCLFGNKWLPLHLKLNIMEAKTIKVILSEEAESFVRLQPVKAQQKITYNIRKLESGKCSITLSTMGKVFRALGIATATLDLGVEGKVALW